MHVTESVTHQLLEKVAPLLERCFHSKVFAIFISDINLVVFDNFDFLLGYPPGDFTYSLFKTQQIYRKLLDTFLGNILNNPFMFRFLSTFSYKKYSIDYTNLVCKKLNSSRFIGTVLTGWDNTPRYGYKGYLFRDFNVFDFKNHLTRIFNKSLEKQKDFMMVKA